MKKLSFFAALAAMLMGFASCEKVEPTALETTDLASSKLAGHVYFDKLDDKGADEGTKLYEGKGTVTIEVSPSRLQCYFIKNSLTATLRLRPI